MYLPIQVVWQQPPLTAVLGVFWNGEEGEVLGEVCILDIANTVLAALNNRGALMNFNEFPKSSGFAVKLTSKGTELYLDLISRNRNLIMHSAHRRENWTS